MTINASQLNFEIELSNKFQDLNQEMVRTSTENNTKESDKQHSSTTTIPQNLPPPVMLKVNENYTVQMKTITDRLPAVRGKLSGEYLKLYTNTHEEQSDLIAVLEELDYEFYAIKSKSERPIKVVIKGLPRNTDTNTIHHELVMLGYTVDKVTQLIGRINKQKLPVFLITLPRNIRQQFLEYTKNFQKQTRRYSCTASGVAIKDEQKANLIANTLKDNFTENTRPVDFSNSIDSDVTSTLQRFFSQPPPTPISPTNPDEVAAYVSKLKIRKTPVPLCVHNFKYKNDKKRAAEPIIRSDKLTVKNNDRNNKLDDEEFKIPLKTSKGNNVPKEDNKIIETKNKFTAVNSANNDVEDVTQAAPKVKPIMMKLFPQYNLIIQEIHRTHPTTTNTHVGGYIKIQAESSNHHREITSFLTDKQVQYYVTDPPANRPLKLVIKGLLASTVPEDIKKMTSLVKELKSLKLRNCVNLKLKAPSRSL
ncbi:uncharacterized protein TNCV_2660431 [Trichonephila clavipes]|uniref:Pre-C2HC domain-containing protein n=1 Tax=Trichonephila clavipes TaxID=2585209 RepID=A0A8X6RFM5_TRICX|nr:uncharacterized protein TNCV_2660431 [Trichonephila clavipes]